MTLTFELDLYIVKVNQRAMTCAIQLRLPSTVNTVLRKRIA